MTDRIKQPAPQTSRRRFLSGIAAVPLLSGIAPACTWSKTEFDTIVIGGGMAGLAATLTLEAEGKKVLLIEAANRLGGRCYTLQTNDGKFDCGATTVGPYYGRVRAFAAQAGAEFVAPPGRDPFSYHLNGEFIPRGDWAGSSANLLTGAEREISPEALEFSLVQKFNKIANVSDWLNEETLKYDVPLDAFLRSENVSEEALRLIALTSNTMSLSETSALFQMREFARLALPNQDSANQEVYAARAGGSYHYIKGGTSVLIDKMAAQLMSAPMLGDPVAAIDVQDGGVTVKLASGAQFAARTAICTAPYSSLRDVKIHPELSGLKLQAVSQSTYTLTTHIFCIPTDPYWEADEAPAGLFADNTIERVFANKDENGNVAWLDLWINGAAAGTLDTMSEREMMDFAVNRLAELRPSTAGKVRAVAAYSWGNNAFAKGNKQVMAPGQIGSIFPEMATPWQTRLRFAGEHTRDNEAGLEAAAATGMREAFAILDQAL